MKHTHINGKHYFSFDSSKAMVDFCEASNWKDHGDDFVGRHFDGWDGVLAAVDQPWQEGADILNAFIERLKTIEIPPIKSRKRKSTFNENEGDEIDLDRLYAGQPFWRKSESETHDGPATVTIVMDACASSQVDTEDILWRGAAAIALTHVLEEKGYGVELWIIEGGYPLKGDSSPTMEACCLKRTSDPLDTSTLVNTASGWFYRSAYFTIIRSVGTYLKKKIQYGLGGVYTPTKKDLDQYTPDDPIYISGVFSFSGACSVVEAELERITSTAGKE